MDIASQYFLGNAKKCGVNWTSVVTSAIAGGIGGGAFNALSGGTKLGKFISSALRGTPLGKGGWLNKGQYVRTGVSRSGGNGVLRTAVKTENGTMKIDWLDLGKL